MSTPFLRHWNASGPDPLTPTAKVATLPSVTATAAGWVTMPGGTGTDAPGSVTVSAATALSTGAPAALDTRTM